MPEEFVLIPRQNCLIFDDVVFVPRSSIRHFLSIMDLREAKRFGLQEGIDLVAMMFKTFQD